MNGFDELVGYEGAKEDLDREVSKAKAGDGDLAVAVLRIADISERDTIAGTLYELASKEENFATSEMGEVYQAIDYVVKFDLEEEGTKRTDSIAMFFADANGYAEGVLSNVLKRLAQKCNYADPQEHFSHIKVVTYEPGKRETVEDLLKAAAEEQ